MTACDGGGGDRQACGGGGWARASIAAALAVPALTGAVWAGGDAASSGLPVPRFVSLKTDRVNVRGGPAKDHDVAFIYTRVGWPVEITAEFENWRRIRDSDGSEGWNTPLAAVRKAHGIGPAENKDDLAPLHAQPDGRERHHGAVAIRRASPPSSAAPVHGA